MWEARQPQDYLCITTCGTLRKDDCLVMGRGIALEASKKYPWLQAALGEAVKRNGLQVEVFTKPRLIAFPVKYQFYEHADLSLIEHSTKQLLTKVERLQLFSNPANNNIRILLGRPGCGNGKLDWLQVQPIMRQYLVDNRFVIFSK